MREFHCNMHGIKYIERRIGPATSRIGAFSSIRRQQLLAVAAILLASMMMPVPKLTGSHRTSSFENNISIEPTLYVWTRTAKRAKVYARSSNIHEGFRKYFISFRFIDICYCVNIEAFKRCSLDGKLRGEVRAELHHDGRAENRVCGGWKETTAQRPQNNIQFVTGMIVNYDPCVPLVRIFILHYVE